MPQDHRSTHSAPSPGKQGHGRRERRLGHPRPEDLTLEEIERILSSDAHYGATQTRNYGERDPLVAPWETLFPCSCGAAPKLNYTVPPPEALKLLSRPIPKGDGQAYFVRCDACGNVAQPSLRDWRASIDWNYLRARGQKVSISLVPYFNLAGLTDDEAKSRLNSIKYDLTLRREQAKRRRERGIDVGGKFLAKLDAYLGWANVALKTIA